MTMREQIKKLNYRQQTLLSGLIGITVKTLKRYADNKLPSSRSTISVIEGGWKKFSKQVLKVK